MKVIGLTGGIASGKNFVAEIFSKSGAVVFDADKEVHELLTNDQALISKVREVFPDCFVEQKIDRKILGKVVFSDEKKLRLLEEIIHPEVRKRCQKFLIQAQKDQKKLVVLNIPLLVEGQYQCDKILAIVVAPSVQKKRFLARARKLNPKCFASEKAALEKKFEKILSKQISNKERKLKADFVINSGTSKAEVERQVKIFLKKLST